MRLCLKPSCTPITGWLKMPLSNLRAVRAFYGGRTGAQTDFLTTAVQRGISAGDLLRMLGGELSTAEESALWIKLTGDANNRTEVHAGEIRIGPGTTPAVKVLGTRQPAIANPTGGIAEDVESRAAIRSILVALRAHGLIET